MSVFRVSMKSPDALDFAIENDITIEDKVSVRELCEKWFRFGEYVELEVDTEAETCKVLEIS